MEAFEKKTLKTSRGFTYTYYTSAGDKTLPALVFQHGWPDHGSMWAGVAGPLQSLHHPIIIPDMLGYDGTDKPTDPAAYRWDGMTQDIIEIIDAEQHAKVISIGHDWGSFAASRLCQYHPDRVVGLVNLNVGYQPPLRQPFNLDAINNMATHVFGYPILAYWTLLTAADGPEILRGNLDRLFHAMHGQVNTLKDFFCQFDGLRNYLVNGGTQVQLRPYAQDAALKQAFIDRFTRDGFEAPVCWYLATRSGIQHESDKNLPAGVEKMEIPVLYIGAKEDVVCRPESMVPVIQAGLLPQLEQGELLDAGHWVTYERPKEVVEQMAAWLKKHWKK